MPDQIKIIDQNVRFVDSFKLFFYVERKVCGKITEKSSGQDKEII